VSPDLGRKMKGRKILLRSSGKEKNFEKQKVENYYD